MTKVGQRAVGQVELEPRRVRRRGGRARRGRRSAPRRRRAVRSRSRPASRSPSDTLVWCCVLRQRLPVQDRRDVDRRQVDEQLAVEREPPPAPRAAQRRRGSCGPGPRCTAARSGRCSSRTTPSSVEARRRLGQPQRRAVDRRRVVAGAAVGACVVGAVAARSSGAFSRGGSSGGAFRRVPAGASSRGASSPAARATVACASEQRDGEQRELARQRSGSTCTAKRLNVASAWFRLDKNRVCRRWQKLQQSAHELD